MKKKTDYSIENIPDILLEALKDILPNASEAKLRELAESEELMQELETDASISAELDEAKDLSRVILELSRQSLKEALKSTPVVLSVK